MKKLLNKKGFTLMEMLIVIAIIVILVAISIPAFSGSLDRANIATDAANLRSARAAYALKIAETSDPSTLDGYVYNIKSGELEATGTADAAHQGSCKDHVNAVIHVVSGDCQWSAGPADCNQP